jgi:hypothetical protein
VFHAGFATEMAKMSSEDRRERSGRRLLSSADRGRIAAREEAERSARSFERGLSAAGALVLLAIVVFGAVAALLVGGAALALTIAMRRIRPTGPTSPVRPVADPEARWSVWRRVEPDPEYLRGRAT